MPPSAPSPSHYRRSLVALVSALATFVALQVLLDTAIELTPELRDPEFGEKLRRLQRLMADHPDRPLLLIVGSSRSSCGLQPSGLDLPSVGTGALPLVFNMAITAYGPIQQVELIERLRRFGIRPRWILAEVHPLLLHQRPERWGEEDWIRPEKLDSADLAVVGPFLSRRREYQQRWAMLRSAPAWWFRFQLLNYLSPGWLDLQLRQDGAWFDLDDYGWLPLTIAMNEDAAAALRRELAHKQYGPAFRDFQVTPVADTALRRFIELAQADGATVGLYLMPEGELFRSWYPAGARQQVRDYLEKLSQAEGVAVYDATTWCGEQEFADSHHLHCSAARTFSRRFGRDIAGPFLARRVRQASLRAPADH
jgi:hypothetical protein